MEYNNSYNVRYTLKDLTQKLRNLETYWKFFDEKYHVSFSCEKYYCQIRWEKDSILIYRGAECVINRHGDILNADAITPVFARELAKQFIYLNELMTKSISKDLIHTLEDLTRIGEL